VKGLNAADIVRSISSDLRRGGVANEERTQNS